MLRTPGPIRQPLLFQPVPTETPYSFASVVDEVRAVWFPEIEDDVEVRFGSLGPLASIWFHRMGRGNHVVVFHPILNQPSVPFEVVRFIAKHELTHIVRPEPGHSDAFWEHEAAVAPERSAAWAWIHRNLNPAMRHSRTGLSVVQTWRRRAPREFGPYTPHLPLDDPPWRVLCPEGGAQLRFHPEWSPTPAPFAPRSVEPRRHGDTESLRSQAT